MLSSSFVWSWDNVFSLYTPEALFTYIVPLLVTVLIDGVIALINQYKNIEDNTYKHDLLRDCTVLGVVVLIIIITLLYISLSQNKISLIVFCVVVTWGLWIMLSSSKEEFKPTAKWKPDGDKDDTSMEAITNG
ncbi:hypothetical protein N5P32_13515 [Marinomonas pontica]|uniref:hypothetical protein n=1 Tax=Marinomonas pontica TaxID=264739 RepID=UPI00224393B1|nr:hypothetical protein [Marinomonas pontica]MCW8356854.1 hypothetical protein [Marinomonas pontica]